MPITTPLPKDENSATLQIVPGKRAIAVTRDTTISTSTEVTLNAATTLVEVNAVGDNIFMKYGTDDVTSSSFDEFIIAGTTRHYSIPFGVTALNFIDSGNGGTLVLIEK